ncbi:MAG TPA: MerR family transcriptional regulator [Candidatus Dormibacteraeota bacterium]|nr:MerR family transcriptional regulator [Candidatus Dormibacteraeota bacterium]
MRTEEVAGKAGVNLQTLRYYERRGLLPEPPGRDSGYPIYRPEAVHIVRFVKRAQQLGLPGGGVATRAGGRRSRELRGRTGAGPSPDRGTGSAREPHHGGVGRCRMDPLLLGLQQGRPAGFEPVRASPPSRGLR